MPSPSRPPLASAAPPRLPPLLRAALLTVVAAALFTAGPGGRARAAERIARWSVGRLEVISPGTPKRMAEGTLVDGYSMKAPVKAVGEAPVGDGVLVVQLAAFSPAQDLPRQPKGLYYVKGTWRLFAAGTPDPGARRSGPTVLHGSITAALPADPTAGGGGFTLRTRVAPRALRDVHAGDGALTVNAERTAELVLTLR